MKKHHEKTSNTNFYFYQYIIIIRTKTSEQLYHETSSLHITHYEVRAENDRITRAFLGCNSSSDDGVLITSPPPGDTKQTNF